VVLKKSILRALKRIVFALPEAAKFPFIRYLIRYSPQVSPEIVVKVADTTEEVEAAFQVVNRAYQETGFHRDPFELNKYQILPMSTILIAKCRGEVVGTLTLVKRSPLGLPLERAFQIEGMLSDQEEIAEITCLAIDRRYRREFGTDALFPLMKYMYHYCVDYFSVRKIFVACLPRESDFYRAILLFQPIKGQSRVEDYLGAPALALYLDLQEAFEKFRTVYNHAPASRNLFKYFTETSSPQLIFPKRFGSDSQDSIWNLHSFRYFLSPTKGFRLPKLTPVEQSCLSEVYQRHPQIQKLFKAS
jgi:hypothetical protein